MREPRSKLAASSLTLLLVLSTLVPPAAAGRQDRTDVDRYVWDLSTLYPSGDAWDADRQAVLRGLEEIRRHEATAGRDARGLADALDAAYDLRSRTTKMVLYGLLSYEVAIASREAQTRYDGASALEARVEAAVEFVEDAVRTAGPERIARWLREEPRLDRHRRRLNRILREAPHSLGRDAQAVLESSGRWSKTWIDVFDKLHETPVGWPTVKLANGRDVVVDLPTYNSLRRSADRGERERVAEAYLGRLASLRDLFGLLLTRRVEADLTLARHRRFESGIDALWSLRDGMPVGSARAMVEAARRGLPALRRYAELRRRALGVERMTFGDLFTSPPSLTGDFTIADARETAVAASAPLGAEYQSRLRARLDEPWFHLPPRSDKRDTFGVFPPVGGAAPYFLMSYRPTFRSSRTFAGGATLMMAFADVPRDRAPDTRDDPPSFSNAVIYVGYVLHDDYLRARAASRDERIALALHAADVVWSQFFRWAIVADLDLRVERLVAEGRPPTGEEVSRMYLELVREYLGPGVDVGDAYGAEWMTMPVPFLSYEHHFWPPAMAGACALVERLRAGDARARAFDRLLGRGELDLSYHLFRDAGIDMASPDAYGAAVRRLEGLNTELASLLDAR